jgi:hypothetical protein
MYLVKNIDQYDENNIFFCDPIKNNIMSDGNFIRILYSNKYFILNGIYLLLSFNDINSEKYYNKYKCLFSIITHKDLIDNIKKIEENILRKLEFYNKIPQYKIYEQIKNGNIKIFCDDIPNSNCFFVLKISGVWETQYSYGLTYKFTKLNYMQT